MYYSTNWNYSLDITIDKNILKIRMIAPMELITTSNLNGISKILQEKLPSIFLSECVNDKNNTFGEEVHNTEIAHLFEHIMLSNLCKSIILPDMKLCEFTGWTTWNWVNNAKGTFDIEITGDFNLVSNFPEIISQSIGLLDGIFAYHYSTPSLAVHST
jgi:hypothetical protein